MNQDLVQTMRRAMVPLDGSISEHVPDIVAAFARLVDPRGWPRLTVIDLTAGSCLIPLLFAARGVRRLVVNDTAERSSLAARALFGRRLLDLRCVHQLVTMDRPQLRPHTPSFHFASDYLTEGVAETFDRLYYARVAADERAVYRYLALRWVLGFVPSPDHEFAILPTHDYAQLARDRAHDWRPYIKRARHKLSVLASLARDLNAAIRLVATPRIELHRADLLRVCGEVDCGRQTLIIVNPPTRGLDEYVVDDQLAHSLLANRWLPLSRSRETAAAFWTRRVEAALRSLPTGGHAVVWGGDGALTWQQCLRVWQRYADPMVVRRAGRGRQAPGWAILHKG